MKTMDWGKIGTELALHPEERHQADKREGTPLLRAKAERSWIVQPGKGKTSG